MKNNSMLAKIRSYKNRSYRTRKKVKSVAPEGRARLCISGSNKNIEAQIIDDASSSTLVCVSSLQKRLGIKCGSNMHAAARVGEKIAELAIAKGIKDVYIDRGGSRYHGRIRSLCESARENGLNF